MNEEIVYQYAQRYYSLLSSLHNLLKEAFCCVGESYAVTEIKKDIVRLSVEKENMRKLNKTYRELMKDNAREYCDSKINNTIREIKEWLSTLRVKIEKIELEHKDRVLSQFDQYMQLTSI